MSVVPVRFAVGEKEARLPELEAVYPLDGLLPGKGDWIVELGFGKGRYLLQRALENPDERYFGVEIVSRYFRMVRDRGMRRGLQNLVVARAEGAYLMSGLLPTGFAREVHVYFPDPWPKARHQKRRLFDFETVDLVLAMLRPDGRLFFATDHVEYGSVVEAVLTSHPALDVEHIEGPWPGGARTNYEAKYVEEGRPILRLVCSLNDTAREALLHPTGRPGIVAATSVRPENDESGSDRPESNGSA